MRPLALLAGFMMIASCYAFKIMTLENYFPAKKDAVSVESIKLKEMLDARLPVTSEATVGKVLPHHVTFAGLSNSIFIIGDDPVSKQWLSKHTEELRQLHALGFITNIKSAETLDELQTLSGLPLLPANVDDLLMILSASHYPLMVNEGVVWQ